jgi:hypothetical protein
MSLVDQMGQSILAKASKRREKEERNQLIGAAGNLATSIINTRLQESAEKFLESEDYLKAQAKQASAYNIAQANRKTYEESMADEGGQLGYASDKIYAKLLTDFNEAYPEEDYDETQRKGYLRKIANERAQSYVDSINSNFEAAIKVRSPEDFERYYAENAPGIRTAGEWLNNKIGGFFNLKSTEDVRAERLEALMTSSETNREAVFEAQKVLGSQAKLPKVAKLAEDIKAFKVTRADYDVLSEKLDNLTASFDDGEDRTVTAIKVKLEHPNKPGVFYEELRVNPNDPASVAAFERGKFGSTVEVTKGKDILGEEYNIYTTYNYIRTPNGYAKVRAASKNDKREYSAGDFREALKPGQLDAATSNYNLVSQSMEAKGFSDKKTTIASAQVTEAYLTMAEGYDATSNEKDAWKSDVATSVATTSMRLRSNPILIDDDKYVRLTTSQTNMLAAAAQTRFFNSTILTDDDWFIKYTGRGTIEQGDKDEFDITANNGLNDTGLDVNSSMYAFDAYYALEQSPNAQKIIMTDSQLSALQEDARLNFGKLTTQARLHLIEGFKAHGPASSINTKEYRGTGYTYVELLEQLHIEAAKRS